jgi:hypothetical protein
MVLPPVSPVLPDIASLLPGVPGVEMVFTEPSLVPLEGDR